MNEQLRLLRPSKTVDAHNLTARQRALWLALRSAPPGGAHLSDLNRFPRYADPSAAMRKLVARGLATRVKSGVYAAVRVTERKV